MCNSVSQFFFFHSVMTNDVEYLLMCFSAIQIFSLLKCSNLLLIFSLDVCFLFITYDSYYSGELYTQCKCKSLSYIWFANIFSHSVVCLFIPLTVSFKEQRLIILMKSNLSIFSFMDCAIGVIFEKSLSKSKPEIFPPMF